MADSADDVADDYRQALEDLTMNSRIEIATLTNIARENANHGLAIAEVLQNHIKKVPPSRTLPALYVLDSIVKNVPTPYALYFGPKLYSIFMGAYTKVDNATRRKMDEMLKTWKEPVPGSLSSKSVFPIEQVRPIENALIAARNAALAAHQNSFQGQQQLLRGRPPVPSRDTPTPPSARGYQPPPQQQPPYPGPNGQQQHPQPYPGQPFNGPHPIPHRATPQPAPPAGQYPPYQQQQQQQQQQQPAGREVYGAPQPGISIDKLKDDIQQLIVAEKAEFAQDPLDTSKQTRLKALLDLQTIIQSQDMPQDQLMIIRDRVAELAVNMRTQPQLQPGVAGAAPPPAAAAGAAGVPSTTHTPIPYTTPTPPVVSQQPTPVPPAAAAVIAAALGRPPSAAVAPPPVAPPPPAASGGGVSIDSLFGQGALATLLSGAARKSTTPQQAPTPQPPPPGVVPPTAAAPATTSGSSTPLAAFRSPPPQRPAEPAKPAAPPTTDPSALLAMLRQSGLIGSGATPAPPSASTTPGSAAAGWAGLHSLPGAGAADGTIQLTPASLKIFRPHLISQLHEDLGPPCTQCGRRFKTDEEGRRKKTAHMDWHFRVHQRSAEAERRGQHRSWYVDELDWIRSREAIDTDDLAPQSQDANLTTNPAGTNPDDLSFSPGDSYPFPGTSTSTLHPTASHHLLQRPASSSSTTTTTTAGPGVIPANINSSSGGAGAGAGGSRVPYLPVPEDSSRVNGSCPICQERFDMKWLDEAQEWVWTDAVMVGGRAFHASCHREAAGGGGGVGSGTGGGMGSVPVVGGRKRKAEDEGQGFRGKVKMESY